MNMITNRPVYNDGIVEPTNPNAFGASIDDNTYYDTVGIMTLDGSVTSIGSNAYQGNEELYAIFVPDTVESIGASAFSGCSNCTVYNFGNTRTTVPTLVDLNAFESSAIYKQIVVPDTLYDQWITSTNWSNESLKNATIKYTEFSKIHNRPLKFTATESSSIDFSKRTNTNPLTLYKSSDGTNWERWTYNAISLNEGDIVYIKGYNPKGLNYDGSNYSLFQIQGGVECEGDVMSLISEKNDDIRTTHLFYHLFENCTGLLSAPTVTGKNFKDYCCSGMFNNCTNLRTIQDEMEVVNVGYQSCYWMFYGCTSLLHAADMPNMATVGYDGMCSMYSHCSSLLTTMSELKPLTLVNGSYSRMFEACTSLTTAMYKIDAMNFTGNWAMDNMFAECVNLERAPILPAEQLNTNCYTKMFYNCAKIDRIECHATNATEANNYMSEWTYGVSPTGTFVRQEGASFYSGVNGIPLGWVEEDTITPLLFTSSGVSTISMVHKNGNNPTFYYSLDNLVYNLWDFEELTLNDNEHLYLRGYNPSGVNTQGAYSTFVIEGNVKITGNMSSLLDQSANATIRPYCFHKLFENCDGLTSINGIIVDVMSPYCCSYMFSGCINLTKTPIIRNETLVEGCFSHMFDGCTSLHIVTIETTNISATNCLDNWLNNVAAEGDFKCLEGMSFTTGTSGIPTNWYMTHPFYLVSRPDSNGNNRHFWRGSSTTDEWISHSYDPNYENRAFEMYEGLDGYVHDYLNDGQFRASQSDWSGNIKLYSVTDTDGASVYIPSGYGLTGGSYNYRAWIAKYSGVTDFANQTTLQGFVNTWGYRKNNTYIATYEKIFA